MLEKAGIPAVPIITSEFKSTAKEMADLWGVPDFRFVMMPHPLSNLTSAELNQRADDLVDKVVGLLRTGQDGSEAGNGDPQAPQPPARDAVAPDAGGEACVPVNAVEQIEICYERGWSDSLPVVPASRSLVNAMLAAACLKADDVIAQMPSRKVAVTAEKVWRRRKSSASAAQRSAR